jgi:type III pantothenate kinase
MLLCIDVGNTAIKFGLFNQFGQLVDYSILTQELNLLELSLSHFFNELLPQHATVKKIFISSVVKEVDENLASSLSKFVKIEPIFIDYLHVIGIDFSLFEHPEIIGADLIASAYYAVKNNPDRNRVVISLGTATVITFIDSNNKFYGGAILPGIGLQSQLLGQKTSLLNIIEIEKPKSYVNSSTDRAIKSGIYNINLLGIKNFLAKAVEEVFAKEKFIILGTGGYAKLYQNEQLYDKFEENMVLKGLKLIAESENV